MCIRDRSQFFKIVEGVDQCATFVARSFMLVAIVGLTPFGFQVQTFLNTVGRNRCIFVIGIRITEPDVYKRQVLNIVEM